MKFITQLWNVLRRYLPCVYKGIIIFSPISENKPQNTIICKDTEIRMCLLHWLNKKKFKTLKVWPKAASIINHEKTTSVCVFHFGKSKDILWFQYFILHFHGSIRVSAWFNMSQYFHPCLWKSYIYIYIVSSYLMYLDLYFIIKEKVQISLILLKARLVTKKHFQVKLKF